MAIVKIALPARKTKRFSNRTGRCAILRMTWKPRLVFSDDFSNMCAQLLYKECIPWFAAAVLGKNAIIYDCMLSTPAWLLVLPRNCGPVVTKKVHKNLKNDEYKDLNCNYLSTKTTTEYLLIIKRMSLDNSI